MILVDCWLLICWFLNRLELSYWLVLLNDSSGEIKATGFNEEAARFHPLFEEDRVYVIETATIKPANKNFNKTDHNYELSFHKGTLVTQCLEATSSEVPRSGYTLKTINDVNQVWWGWELQFFSIFLFASEYWMLQDVTFFEGMHLMRCDAGWYFSQ